ncbi:hypothetical protein Egran_01691 [Elaphomyces granulatus]|uniref:RING zinc finger-like domain-containing protein n=1 Tax=Elaphomyces granulatus TaxID=519963 RepID=A0A232M2I0_9EURO|nr:hypothetical protein Egran_01691 [Elaphomyces granulatus]
MPPRSSLTSSFSVSDANNEVVCPLTNNDGSNCRKRCLGEKRFRSMQEHIRRAHPSHYIPKLPATEESFQLMVTATPDQRANATSQSTTPQSKKHHHANMSERDIYVADGSSPAPPRTAEDAHPAAATAAVALAQLHHHRLASDWDSEMVGTESARRAKRESPRETAPFRRANASRLPKDTHSDNDIGRDRMRSSIELPPLRDHFKQESLPPFQSSRPRELLPSILSHSPPGRSSTLPPIQRRDKIQRPRKSSITQNSRRPKHDRTRSKEYARRPSLNERKALSAEPQTAAWVQERRWEDLIEAATSATEADDDRDSTPVPQSPLVSSLLSNVTSAPSASKDRSSLPPAFQSTPGLLPSSHRQFKPLSYTASPLQKSLTPPPYEIPRNRDSELEPFPSIETSLDSASSVSGKTAHPSTGVPTSANSDSSPLSLYPASHPHQNPHRPQHRFSNPTPSSFRNQDVHIYCAKCSRPWPLTDCFACTECICGVCKDCSHQESAQQCEEQQRSLGTDQFPESERLSPLSNCWG